MRTVALLSLAASLMVVSVTGYAAEDAAETEARIDHYEVMELPSAEQALAWLAEKPQKMAEALEQNQFEAIHEESYYLEAAVDALRAEVKTEEQGSALDALDESVQTVHFASENHEGDALRKAFPELLHNAAKVRGLL